MIDFDNLVLPAVLSVSDKARDRVFEYLRGFVGDHMPVVNKSADVPRLLLKFTNDLRKLADVFELKSEKQRISVDPKSARDTLFFLKSGSSWFDGDPAVEHLIIFYALSRS